MIASSSRQVLTKHPESNYSQWAEEILLDLMAEHPLAVACIRSGAFPADELSPPVAPPLDATSTPASRNATKLYHDQMR
jgi:hypothetical protein